MGKIIILGGRLGSSLLKYWHWNLSPHTGNSFDFSNAGGFFVVSGLFDGNYHLAVGSVVYRSGYSAVQEICHMGNLLFQTSPNLSGAEIYAEGMAAVHIQAHVQADIWVRGISIW